MEWLQEFAVANGKERRKLPVYASLHAAVHAVHTLGRYPIAADLSAIEIAPPTFQPFDEWLKGQPEADSIFKAREAGAAPRTFTG
jgi:short-subunit dehydrogenase involved in D-alanine esterification of teichoic acids